MKVHGTVRPPGDKSISHRVLILAALARGRSEIQGLLTGEDVKSTARVLRQLGAAISPIREDGVVTVEGGPLTRPSAPLLCGNSGTTARLLLGLLAGHPFTARLTGDASLRRRPMRRVTEPLRLMGARVDPVEADTLPLAIRGGSLRTITYDAPIASAQVKGALLLAALTGRVAATLREPYRSRDHMERLFVHLGLALHERDGRLVFEPPQRRFALPPLRVSVPGDISSAAFLVGAAVLAEGGDLLIEHVGLNPTRTGFLSVMGRMGARIERLNLHDVGGEPVGDLLARPSRLRGTEVAAAEIPTLIDEVPILAAVASRVEGETVFHEVGELRVKESNRLDLLAANLRALGVAAEARGNDLYVQGTERPPRGRVDTDGDHRLAMAFAVLGTLPQGAVRLSERRSVAISYPGFFRDLRRVEDGDGARHRD